MREFVEFIAKHLVDQPESVAPEEEMIDNTLVLKLKVAQDDVGKIIGRKGRTAQAIRLLSLQ